MGRASKAKLAAVTELLKLDFGCGPHKREGFHGVDQTAFPGVDTVCDLTVTPWPWADNSVAEAHASHFIEHLDAWQRVAFCNELYRVLVPNGTCSIVVPHWNSCRAYGDPTHQWPPVSEFWFYYLNKDWRMANAPHCDGSIKPGVGLFFVVEVGHPGVGDLVGCLGGRNLNVGFGRGRRATA